MPVVGLVLECRVGKTTQSSLPIGPIFSFSTLVFHMGSFVCVLYSIFVVLSLVVNCVVCLCLICGHYIDIFSWFLSVNKIGFGDYHRSSFG